MSVGASCECLGKDVHLLLLHCQVATRLWSVVLSLFGTQWVMPNTVKEALHSWVCRRGGEVKGLEVVAPFH